jgi:hypothetical protein
VCGGRCHAAIAIVIRVSVYAMFYELWNTPGGIDGGQIVTAHYRAAQQAALDTSTQGGDEEELEEVNDYSKLRELLSRSSTVDAYCRSALYFALTGRRKVWIVKHGDKYLVLLPHPNVTVTLLVFFPFVSSAVELAEQVEALCRCQKFLSQFQDHEILLARVPELIAEGLFSRCAPSLQDCTLERVDEKKLDWLYPSYDIELQRLSSPQGGKLKVYRRKLRKFCDQNIEMLRPRLLSTKDLVKAVHAVSEGWVHTKLASKNSHQLLGISKNELVDCYRAMARLNTDRSLAIDGLILKRGGAYVAFAFWERPANGKIVPCLAALPVSHEKGLSEYLYFSIAECLKDEGYKEMCIGGSETASLDQFKKKLDPSKAHKLQTIRITLRSSQMSA